MANEVFFTQGRYELASAGFDWETVADARIRVLLLTVATGAGNPDHDTVTAAIASATECSGTGYVRKDVPASGRSITVDDTNNRIQLEADDITWTGADFTDVAAWLMYYDSTGTDSDATNIPIAYGELVAEPNGGPLTLGFPNGVARHS